MSNPKFSDEFKLNAIKLANNRGDRSLLDVAKELNISKSSLDKWLKNHREQLNQLSSDSKHWSAQEKLLAIAESHALTGEELSQWCRMKGIFEHQLKSWKREFIESSEKKNSNAQTTELKTLKDKNKALEADLKRKNKALAESAALLVLSKKFNALISGEED